MPPKKPATVEDYVNKLIDVSQMIRSRMGLKPAEKQRVVEAFDLLAAGEPPAGSKALANKRTYVGFLQRVQKVLGLNGVVLCAVGLGMSAVVSMGDRFRVDLPHMLQKREEEIAQDDLQSIANTYAAKLEFNMADQHPDQY